MAFNGSLRALRKGARLGVLGAATVMLISPVRAWAWGCDGHQAVAMIAEKHMTAHALAMANKILQSAPIDPTLPRYCGSPGSDLLMDSATWPDDIRKLKPEASAWHYIDIPRDAPRSAVAGSCPASVGCVTTAIKQQLELLRNQDTNPHARADALRFVIHFVGDIHQPLHCVTNNDMGGNCVPIDFFGNPPVEKNPQTESYAPNLHSVWDSALIGRMRGTISMTDWAGAINQQFTPQMRDWEKQKINVEDWAWEGHELADSVAYAKLPVAVPVEKPAVVKACADDNHISTRMLNLHEQVSLLYEGAVAPTINQQIAKAGVRLAMVLNQIWP